MVTVKFKDGTTETFSDASDIYHSDEFMYMEKYEDVTIEHKSYDKKIGEYFQKHTHTNRRRVGVFRAADVLWVRIEGDVA